MAGDIVDGRSDMDVLVSFTLTGGGVDPTLELFEWNSANTRSACSREIDSIESMQSDSDRTVRSSR